MKSLYQYILENYSGNKLFTQDEIKKLFGFINREVFTFADNFIHRFLSKINKEYSLKNKQHRGYLWNIFYNNLGKSTNKELLKKIHFNTPEGLCAFIGDNIDILNSKLDKPYFKSNLTKIQREYNEWKNSDQYVPLEEYDENDPYEDDEELGRAFIIYYAYDPADKSLLRVYRINGKTTDKNVIHIQNLHKADWNYETKLGYFHANTCTVEYYRKTGKEQLIQDYISNDEIYE